MVSSALEGEIRGILVAVLLMQLYLSLPLALILEDQPRMKPNSMSDGSCIDSVKEALRISTEFGVKCMITNLDMAN